MQIISIYECLGEVLGNVPPERTLSCQSSLDRRRSGSSTSASSHSDILQEKGEDSDYEEDTAAFRLDSFLPLLNISCECYPTAC